MKDSAYIPVSIETYNSLIYIQSREELDGLDETLKFLIKKVKGEKKDDDTSSLKK